MRPQCAGCTCNGLQCVWWSDKETIDARTIPKRRRREIDERSDSSRGNLIALTIELPPLVPMPSPFQLEKHRYLFRFFKSSILPRLVRQNSLARYTDQTFMLRLALRFSPLMGALISVAGMQLAPAPHWSVPFAVESYIQAILGLRERLSQTTDFGCDDALLATVVTLSVFEVRIKFSVPSTRKVQRPRKVCD